MTLRDSQHKTKKKIWAHLNSVIVCFNKNNIFVVRIFLTRILTNQIDYNVIFILAEICIGIKEEN